MTLDEMRPQEPDSTGRNLTPEQIENLKQMGGYTPGNEDVPDFADNKFRWPNGDNKDVPGKGATTNPLNG
ncbi:MAG: hypothetical protein WA021_00100 [Minisyncoccia bacterium]